MRYRLLDLCCKSGIASDRYFNAGFNVMGIDNQSQVNYPYRFKKCDAYEYLIKNWKKFDVIHISPNCQFYSNSTPVENKINHSNDIPLIREIIKNEKITIPIIIENVMSSPLIPDLVLRGDMFGLKALKTRKFEFHNFFMFKPGKPQKNGSVKNGDFTHMCGSGSFIRKKNLAMPKFKKSSVLKTWKYALNIPIDRNVTRNELSNCIPFQYTEFIGKELIIYLNKINNYEN